MKRSQIFTVVSLLVFVCVLAWVSIDLGKVSCEVCIEFKGRRNCASVAAPTKAEAMQTGRTTACGTIASGVRDSFACGAAQPASFTCW